MTLIFPAPTSGAATNEGNLILLERFNKDLSAWKLSTKDGTAEIVVEDFNKKLCLKSSNETSFATARKSLIEPETKWIFEYDQKIEKDGDVGIMEMLEADGKVIASVHHGATPGQVAFSTDRAGPSLVPWASHQYKQVILMVDRAGGTITCNISEDDHSYGSLTAVGAPLRYSGAAISAVRFRTGSGNATVLIDEVKVYCPNMFIIGDSISDGKPLWSTHPGYPPRSTADRDETSSPSFQLSLKLGHEWVANRGFGGTSLAGVDGRIQSVVLAHGAKTVIISVGHNDIYPGQGRLEAMQSLMNSIIRKMESAGISGRHIVLCSVTPSGMIDTPGKRALRENYNQWLKERAMEAGATFADVAESLRDPGDPNKLKREYDAGDGVHLSKEGSGVHADTVFKAMDGAAR